MYWYIESNRPLEQIRRFEEIRKSDEAFAKLSKADLDIISKQLSSWHGAMGKYLYAPNMKLFKAYLQPHSIIASSAGNRAGKTSGHVINVIMQIEGWHPLQKQNLERLCDEAVNEYIDTLGEKHDVSWVKPHCKKLYSEKKFLPDPPIYGRCVAPDYPNYIEPIIGPEYEKWATKSMLAEVAYTNMNKRIINWKNGGYVKFLTIQQELKAHGGWAGHVVHIDEEIPQEYWVENNMRLMSLDGRILYGATAIEGVTWTEEAIFEKGENGDPNIYVFEMSSYENPWNTEDVVKRLLEQCMDETDVDIRIHGKRKRRGGKVYPMCKDTKPWIIPSFEIPKLKGLLVMAIDPHPQIENAILWTWVDYEGIFHDLIEGKPNLYNVAEIFEHGNVKAMNYYIELTEANLGRKHDYVVCDPSAWNVDQNKPEERSLADQYGDFGIYVQKGSKDRTANIIRVGGLLTLWHERMPVSEMARAKGNPDIILRDYPDARPQLFTFEELRVLRQERRNWHYPVYRRAALAEHNQIKPKPVDKDDHLLECEGRIGAFVDDFNEQELITMPAEDHRTYTNSKGEVLDISFDDNEDLNIDFTDAITA